MNRVRGEMRAIAATTRKELLLMRRYPADIVALSLWMLLLPLAYIAQATAFSSGSASVAAFERRAGTDDYVAFLYIGWSVYLWITAVLWGPGLALRQERQRGSFETVFASPASRFTLLFGGVPAQVVPVLVIFVSAAASMRLLFGVPLGWGDLARWLTVLAFAFPVLMALGAMFATVSLSLQDTSGLLQITRGAFTLLCGVTYPLAVLPVPLRAVGEALPPTQALDALRAVTVGHESLLDRLPGLALLLVEAFAAAALAMALLWVSVRHGRRTGKLGLF
ncbi:ABC transporter permease [Actinomadura opuntiae]|uniref:ABC transporter permease n=1 Tax=Actinomadura sp. OS1-43 TaxID=604315 RepID=UPI00255ACEC9|nr:ABC transporter permease [Actinomadura sp. OS1-43]MDL4817201.1 ABC transporter permease [Actinomadura sp. OS1-43]